MRKTMLKYQYLIIDPQSVSRVCKTRPKWALWQKVQVTEPLGRGTILAFIDLPYMAKDQHGVVRDEKGQEQPTDKESAQKAGVKEQIDAGKSKPESPGEPAGGE